MKIKIKKPFKSIKTSPEFELPDFTVLTGKNGSGKSHLLEAISKNDVAIVTDVEGKILKNVKYIPFNGLNPNVVSEADYKQIQQKKEQLWNKIRQHISNIKKGYSNRINFYLSLSPETKREFIYFYELADENLDKLTREFVYDNYYGCTGDKMTEKLAELFKSYHINWSNNKYLIFLNKEEGEHNPVLTDEEFIAKYGPKPWEFVNTLLEETHLPYSVNGPMGDRDDPFNLVLKDRKGLEISPNDLSTGERVLLSLAVSIYGTEETKDKLDLLLIDEPDAGLHPEYSKFLIEVILEHIVKKAGVKVVITTHNPTTVALAPEESIFKMEKGKSVPKKVSKKNAIGTLLYDFDNIRLSIENKRAVFVESMNDVQYYGKIHQILSNTMDFTTSPVFMVPRHNDDPNCGDVRILCNQLANAGVISVYGIVDSDKKNMGNDYLLVLGEGNRYAIDNYILDPIFVGLLLIDKGIIKPQDINPTYNNFVDMSKMTHDEAQQLIDTVCEQLGFNKDNVAEYKTICEETFVVDESYFSKKGHYLEDKLTQKWEKVKEIKATVANKKKREAENLNEEELKKEPSIEGALKLYVLDKIIYNYPKYISMDFVELFKKIV